MFDMSSTPENVRKKIYETKIIGAKKLILDGEGLTEFPIEILQLEELEELYLGNNNISFIPPGIKNLKKIRVLSLIKNQISIIPIEISFLGDLVQLGLNQNTITEIPEEICDLKKLEVLGLNNNRISIIPQKIKNLKNLKLFGIESNFVQTIPFEIVRLNNLLTFHVKDNPLQAPPIEVATSKNNIEAIKNYFLELRKNDKQEKLFEVKLIFVGNGGVGKTTLAQTLMDINYRFNFSHQSTHGIEINAWNVPKSEFEKYSNSNQNYIQVAKDFRLNLWDFGGQEIYYSTHQFFLTKRSVYLLITESRKEDSHLDINYWLNIIELLGEKSPIILVLNKADQPNKDLPIKEIKKRFPNVIDLIKTSCLSEHRLSIQNLKEKIFLTIIDKNFLPHIGSIIPKSWTDVRKKLRKLKNKGLNYINLEEYLNIGKKFSLDKNQALWLSEFLHDIGFILHFQESPELSNLIVLNHEWVTSAVYKIFDNETIIKKYGRFNYDDLETIWDDQNYTSKRFELITLMQKFELCFNIENHKYLAPQLLPVDEIDLDIDQILNELNIENKFISFEYQYKFMPKGIISRLIVKLNDLIIDNKYWRFGVVLQYEKSMAIIKENYFESKITITIFGKERREFLSIMRSKIKEIHNLFENIEFDEFIPCSCMKDNSFPIKRINYFNFDSLRKRMDMGKYTAECPQCFENQLVINIMEGVSPVNISNSVKNLLKNNRISEAFDLVDSKINHLKDFELENIFILLKNRYLRISNSHLKKVIEREDYEKELSMVIESLNTLAYKIGDNENFLIF